MNTRLFISEQEVELDTEVEFLLTREFEELSNPTVIINDWSKTVSIPATLNNDQLFGRAYDVTRVITSAQGTPILTKLENDVASTSTLVNVTGGWTSTMSNSTINISSDSGTSVYACSGLYILPCLVDLQNNIVMRHGSNKIIRVKTGQTIIDYLHAKPVKPINAFVLTLNGAANKYPRVLIKLPSTVTEDDLRVTFNVSTFTYASSAVNFVSTVSIQTMSYRAKDIDVYFDPYKKLDFHLEWNGNNVMSGYAKLIEIVRKDTRTTYNVTLNGVLGKLFQEYQKINFDPSSITDPLTSGETIDYYIDGSEYYSEDMTRLLVAASWNNERDDTHLAVSGASAYEKVGWAISNAFNEDVDYKSYAWQDSANTEHIANFEDTLPSNFVDKTQISKSTAIGDGIKPRDLGEFRSYLQQPFFYWDMLWQIFQAKAEKLGGYKWELDSDWFNKDNPYWRNFILCAKALKIEGETTDTSETVEDKQIKYRLLYPINGLTTAYQAYAFFKQDANNVWGNVPQPYTASSFLTPATYEGVMPRDGVISKLNTYYIGQYSGNAIYRYNEQYFEVPAKKKISITVPRFKLKTSGINGTYTPFTSMRVKGDALLVVDCWLWDKANNVVCSDTYTATFGSSDIVFPDSSSFDFETYVNPAITIEGENRSSSTANIVIQMMLRWQNYTNTPLQGTFTSATGWSDSPTAIYISAEDTVQMASYDTLTRSFSNVTLNRLWDNSYKPFDFILNYCKMFRISILPDTNAKTLTFKRLSQFMSEKEGQFLDWTDNIDYSKEYKITPVSWENKYVLFNYEDSELHNNANYNKKYGVNYGEKRLATTYNFNADTTSLFSGLRQCINYSPYVNSWENLCPQNPETNYPKVVYILANEFYTDDIDNENNKIDIFGTFGFSDTHKAFDTTSNLRSCIVTDDSNIEIRSKTYCYNLTGNYTTGVTYYRTISDRITKNDNVLLSTFAVPSEDYTSTSTDFSNAKDIYTLFWKRYAAERYDKQNKKVTCYVKINPLDMANYKFNQFIKLGHQLYSVNKIYDYNLNNIQTTKMDLLTIQDPSGYYVTEFDELLGPADITIPTTFDDLWQQYCTYTGNISGYHLYIYTYEVSYTIDSANKRLYFDFPGSTAMQSSGAQIIPITYDTGYPISWKKDGVTKFSGEFECDGEWAWMYITEFFSGAAHTNEGLLGDPKEEYAASTWTMTSSDSWLTPGSYVEGQWGITVSLTANTTGSARVGYIYAQRSGSDKIYKQRIVQAAQ